MSGLVCCTTEECMKHYTMIVPNTVNSDNSNNDIINTSNNNNNTTTNNKGNKNKKNSIFTFANRDECGPNCKCDSPWKYELPADRITDNQNETNSTEKL